MKKIRNTPEALSADHLMAVIRHLSVTIGPRRPASAAEREAANFIYESLRGLQRRDEIEEQSFRSIKGFRGRIAPLSLVTGASLFYGLREDRRSHWLAGLVSIAMSVMARDAFLHRRAVWESLLPRGDSQNIIVRIPPRRRIRRRIVFVAHMDSGVHRLTTDARVVAQVPRTVGGITLMALTGGVLTLLAGRNQRWRFLRGIMGAGALAGATWSVADEMGPDVSGANGNASGVAALLGLAEMLQHNQFQSTEIVLAFTGAGTAVGTGMDVLASKYGDAWKDALWVVVNNVGTGELCWPTRHGISPYAYYHPDAVGESIMQQVAAARPDLGLMGKSLLTLDELALLRDRDLHAVALMAYDRVTGLIPNWRQNSDTIHAIDPQTVSRAAQALWTAAEVMDTLEQWPPSR